MAPAAAHRVASSIKATELAGNMRTVPESSGTPSPYGRIVNLDLVIDHQHALVAGGNALGDVAQPTVRNRTLDGQHPSINVASERAQEVVRALSKPTLN